MSKSNEISSLKRFFPSLSTLPLTPPSVRIPPVKNACTNDLTALLKAEIGIGSVHGSSDGDSQFSQPVTPLDTADVISPGVSSSVASYAPVSAVVKNQSSLVGSFVTSLDEYDEDSVLSTEILGQDVTLVAGEAISSSAISAAAITEQRSCQITANPITHLTTNTSPVNLGTIISTNVSFLAYAVSVGGSKATSANSDAVPTGLVRIISLHSTQRELIRGFTAPLADLSWASRDCNKLAAVDRAGMFGVWFIEEVGEGPVSSTPVFRVATQERLISPHHRISWHPSSTDYMAISCNQSVQVWHIDAVLYEVNSNVDIPAGVIPDSVLRLDGHTAPINDLCFSPNGKVLATAGDDGYVRFWDLTEPTGHCMNAWMPHDGKPVNSVSFVSSAAVRERLCNDVSKTFYALLITAATGNSELKMWRTDSWECIQSLQWVRPDGSPAEHRLAFDPDGRFLCAADVAARRITVLSMRNLPESAALSHAGSGALDRCAFVTATDFALTSPIYSFMVTRFAVTQDENMLDLPGHPAVPSLIRAQIYGLQATCISEFHLKFRPVIARPESVLIRVDSCNSSLSNSNDDDCGDGDDQEDDDTESSDDDNDNDDEERDGFYEDSESLSDLPAPPNKMDVDLLPFASTASEPSQACGSNGDRITTDDGVNGNDGDVDSNNSCNVSIVESSSSAVARALAERAQRTLPVHTLSLQEAASSLHHHDSNHLVTERATSVASLEVNPAESVAAPSEYGVINDGSSIIDVDENNDDSRSNKSANSAAATFAFSQAPGDSTAPSERGESRADDIDLTARVEHTITRILNMHLEKAEVAARNDTDEVDVMKEALQKTLVPIIHAVITNSFEQLDLSEKTANQLTSMIKVALPGAVVAAISSSELQASITQQVSGHLKAVAQQTFRDFFKVMAIPAFEKSCQGMFNQINDTFTRGTELIVSRLDDASGLQSIREQLVTLEASTRNTHQSVLHMMQMQQQQSDRLQAQLAVLAESCGLNGLVEAKGSGSGAIPAADQRAASDAAAVWSSVQRFLSQNDLAEAFKTALGSKNLTLLMKLVRLVDPAQLFRQPSGGPLSQAIVLSLLQQLGYDLSDDTAVKLAYLQEAIMALDFVDPVTASHGPRIISGIEQRLVHHQKLLQTSDPVHTIMRSLLFVVKGVIAQYPVNTEV